MLVAGDASRVAGLGELAVVTNGMYVAKLDPSGTPVWLRGAGDAPGWSDTQAVAVDASGNVVVAGEFGGTIDLGTGPIHGAESMSVFSDKFFVAKYDPNGEPLWAKAFAADDFYGNFGALSVDSVGNWLLATSIRGVADFGGGEPEKTSDNEIYVSAFDASGDHRWTRRFGEGIPTSVRFDANGNIVVVGVAEDDFDAGLGPMRVSGGYDGFFARLGSDGKPLCARLLGDDADQQPNDVAVGVDGSAWVAGSFSGSIALTEDNLVSAGGRHAFLLQIGP